MDYVVICLVALVASGLTLISGFGLGTLLLPAFAFFFPLPTAVALTAVVHLANNLFKLGLVGLRANWGIVARFGLPALVCAVAGARLLRYLTDLSPLAVYRLGDHVRQITPVGVVVGVLMILFAILEIHPRFQKASIPSRWFPLGGALSGFIGGLSGHQGALRSAFLLRFKEELTKESFIATNVVIAVLVDAARITNYRWSEAFNNYRIVLAAVLAAFLGAWLGAMLMKKITLQTVQRVVSAMLVLLGAGIASGLVG